MLYFYVQFWDKKKKCEIATERTFLWCAENKFNHCDCWFESLGFRFSTSSFT